MGKSAVYKLVLLLSNGSPHDTSSAELVVVKNLWGKPVSSSGHLLAEMMMIMMMIIEYRVPGIHQTSSDQFTYLTLPY